MSNLFIEQATLQTKILTGPQSHQYDKKHLIPIKLWVKSEKKVFVSSDVLFSLKLSVKSIKKVFTSSDILFSLKIWTKCKKETLKSFFS